MTVRISINQVMEEMKDYVPDNHGIRGEVDVTFDSSRQEFVVQEINEGRE